MMLDLIAAFALVVMQQSAAPTPSDCRVNITQNTKTSEIAAILKCLEARIRVLEGGSEIVTGQQLWSNPKGSGTKSLIGNKVTSTPLDFSGCVITSKLPQSVEVKFHSGGKFCRDDGHPWARYEIVFDFTSLRLYLPDARGQQQIDCTNTRASCDLVDEVTGQKFRIQLDPRKNDMGRVELFGYLRRL